jgi:hypothetical protein
VYVRSKVGEPDGGQKEVNFHKEISLFCYLNSIYSDIDLKLWNMKEKYIFFHILKKKKNSQASQLLVHATTLLK